MLLSHLHSILYQFPKMIFHLARTEQKQSPCPTLHPVPVVLCYPQEENGAVSDWVRMLQLTAILAQQLAPAHRARYLAPNHPTDFRSLTFCRLQIINEESTILFAQHNSTST